MTNMSVSILLRLVDQLTGPAKKISNSYRSMQQSVTSSANQLTGATNRSTTSIHRMGAAASSTQARVDRLSRSMRNLRVYGHNLAGGGLMTGFGGGLVGFGIGRTLFNFEDTMNEVQALMSASDKAMKGLRHEVMEVGSKSRYTATQVGKGLVELARAGVYDPDEARGLLDSTVGLAEATNMQMSRAADISTNIAKAFGKEINKAAMTEMVDALAHSTRRTNFDLGELAESMKYTAGTAHSFGLSMKDTLALLMVLAQRGQKGSIAGTGLSRIIEGSIGRSRSGKPKSALEAIGIDPETFFDEKGNIRIFEMIEMFRKAREEHGKIATDSAIMKAFDVRGGRMMQMLVNSTTEEIQKFREIMSEADGAVEEMRRARMKGLPGAWYYLVASIEKAVLTMGEKGGLTDTLIDVAAELTSWAHVFSDANPALVGFISHALMAATAIGALAIPTWLTAKALGYVGRKLMIGPLVKLLTGAFAGLARILTVIAAGELMGLAGGLAAGAKSIAATGRAAYAAGGAFGVMRLAFLMLRNTIALGLAIGGIWLIYEYWDKLAAIAKDPINLKILWPEMPEWLSKLIDGWSEMHTGYADKRQADHNSNGRSWQDFYDRGGWMNYFGWGPDVPPPEESSFRVPLPQAQQRGAPPGVPDAIAKSMAAEGSGQLSGGMTIQANGPKVVVNQAPPNVNVSVTVNATTNASPEAIGAAAASAVGNKVRGALSDAPLSAP